MDNKELHAKVTEAIGEDGIAKLTALGLTICNIEDLDAFEKDMEASNERNRELARAAMRAGDMRCVLVEVVTIANGQGLRVIVCDPDGDEVATLRKVCDAMGWANDGAAKTPVWPRRVDAKGEE